MFKEYLPDDPNFRGLFVVFVNRAPGVVWHVQRRQDGSISHIVRRKPQPYVNHYSFHIMDPDWGHVIIRLCGHPPFPAQVILNGHEYVSRLGKRAGIDFCMEDNCFSEITDAHRLQKHADTLCSLSAIGRLKQVCERWIYSSCLCFALSLDEQQRSGFHYSYSLYQAEYSRNLQFIRGKTMETVFNSIIDRTRSLLKLKRVKTIFGYKSRPTKKNARRRPARFEVVVERPAYNLIIFKIHFGKLTVKIYSKGERTLRIEAIAHNSQALRCGKALEKFPQIIQALKDILERFVTILHSIDVTFLGPDTIEKWRCSAKVGAVRVGGIDIYQPRQQAVMQAVIALSVNARGFCASQVAASVRDILQLPEAAYQARHAAYDLKKLRGQQLLYRINNSHYYQAPPQGIREMAAGITLQQKVLKPLLANAGNLKMGRPCKHNQSPIDIHYKNIQREMQKLFQTINIAA
jgi:hypothetical protein